MISESGIKVYVLTREGESAMSPEMCTAGSAYDAIREMGLAYDFTREVGLAYDVTKEVGSAYDFIR